MGFLEGGFVAMAIWRFGVFWMKGNSLREKGMGLFQRSDCEMFCTFPRRGINREEFLEFYSSASIDGSGKWEIAYAGNLAGDRNRSIHVVT